ncbi:MAG: hypothetical protein EA425_09700 [Puniceicoccaceae bacterium]|nr:MAG: hypothetical protein EA425_09700 [Puniceicoccaceae bacterium]
MKPAQTLPAAVGSLLLLLAAPLASGPFMTIGDRAWVNLTASGTLRYTDNVYLDRTNRTSDLVVLLSPGLRFNYGEPGINQGSLTYREDFVFYTDNSSLDSNLSFLETRNTFNNPRSEVRLDGSLQQLSQNSRDFRGDDFLVRRTEYRARVYGEYELTEKTSMGAGLQFDRRDFKTFGFLDRDRITVPVDLFYELTPLVDLSIGYRYRTTDLKSPFLRDSKDHRISVGLRGEVAPKVTGFFQVGAEHRRFEVTGSDTILAVEGSLTYAATPKTAYSLTASRDFGNSGIGGDTIERSNVELRARYSVSELWSTGAGVSYERADYLSGRKDDYITADASVAYSPNEYTTLSAGYIFLHNDSNRPQSEFRNNVLSFSASFRY